MQLLPRRFSFYPLATNPSCVRVAKGECFSHGVQHERVNMGGFCWLLLFFWLGKLFFFGGGGFFFPGPGRGGYRAEFLRNGGGKKTKFARVWSSLILEMRKIVKVHSGRGEERRSRACPAVRYHALMLKIIFPCRDPPSPFLRADFSSIATSAAYGRKRKRENENEREKGLAHGAHTSLSRGISS
ncbi:hypothetical protein LX32DRAFT_285510 [Colletotrichum zoysiae]|uniref:Uncharacterized protein n=1 Tax=Colletotrichum zoysiae TaxID=1216348 RepID=A0AAD9M472_9PEZI|nr:hypothetical protein LX32DRAFT_285510 [Colletotrichum zoysiae]